MYSKALRVSFILAILRTFGLLAFKENLLNWASSLCWLCTHLIKVIKKSTGAWITQRRSLKTQMLQHLFHLYDKYMVVPVDNASINIIFVCKLHYIDSVIKVVAVGNPHNYPTYITTKLTKRKFWTMIGLNCLSLEFQL